MNPLAGLKVLDLSRWIAGPHCANLLGALGADVLKVEPLSGDPTRQLPPTDGGISLYFATYNANKTSVGVDLRSQAVQSRLAELARTADVIVENFRPGVIEKIGLGVGQLRAMGSRAVLVSITGFGQSGEHAHLPALNPVVESAAGLAWYLGDETGRPRVTPNYMADHLVGTFAAFQVTAALSTDRQEARQLDISMMNVLTAHLGPSMSAALNGVDVVPPGGNRDAATAPGNTFRCSDGRFIYIDAATDAQFAALARSAGMDQLIDDPAFRDGPSRFANAATLENRLGTWFASHPAFEVEAVLQKHSIPCAVVRSFGEAVEEFGDAVAGVRDIEHQGTSRELRLPAALLGPASVHSDDLTLWIGDAADQAIAAWATARPQEEPAQ
ncbi:MAG TPA: CoA transferase [Egicoccus sp.]|nr:CoA transferase [Egicoccus sp.]HSK24608.1 CoA transferase [Egicoccus sp.]